MKKFKLVADFKPTGDQPKAVRSLTKGIKAGFKEQVLLGVTGSGKTFTMANVIADLNLPTLVISHNKTLGAQLYQEFRDFFPGNAVSYFVSYYDYYQPEAYIPQTDTYIEKETAINQEIDQLRLQATSNLLRRRDTLIVASVSCIYNIGSPAEYNSFVIEISIGSSFPRNVLFQQLVRLQYHRSEYDFTRGTFRVRGESVDIFPAYTESAIRIDYEENMIAKIWIIDPLTGKKIEAIKEPTFIYPAKHYLMSQEKLEKPFNQIQTDLKEQVEKFKKEEKYVEAQRLDQKVNYDLEMIKEFGSVNGIENYSRYFDNRKIGEPPYTLLDYYQYQYGEQWLLIIDESHITIPQIRGMYQGDFSRKQTLVDYGFRLPAAFDNRPLRFNEFLEKISSTLYISATPADWEIEQSRQVVEQLVRPTGLLDAEIEIRPTSNQITDLIKEIILRKKRKERVLVTTLTKKIAEDLTDFLRNSKDFPKIDLKVQYLHSEIETLDRQDILDDLREGKYDILIGINLLREGLDLPEVSLVAILDADKEGFLRSATSLIQIMGRASRHKNGRVIMYADNITQSMQKAINEVNRRRDIQIEYNRRYKIVPKTISKPIRKKIIERHQEEKKELIKTGDIYQLLPSERAKLIKNLQQEMRQFARELNFESAARLRDKIAEIKEA